MRRVAEQIRAALREAGIRPRQVSVRCRLNWTIGVESKPGVERTVVRDAVLKAYHAEPHHWLCVECDREWLPMPHLPNGAK